MPKEKLAGALEAVFIQKGSLGTEVHTGETQALAESLICVPGSVFIHCSSQGPSIPTILNWCILFENPTFSHESVEIPALHQEHSSSPGYLRHLDTQWSALWKPTLRPRLATSLCQGDPPQGVPIQGAERSRWLICCKILNHSGFEAGGVGRDVAN